VGAYALGLLEAEERTVYERHLITCAHCLRTLEGLAPLIELLGQVDAATLLADTEFGRVRRSTAHPPGAVVTLFPRQREPTHDRIRRPHLRAWDELDDRFRTPERPGGSGREAGQRTARARPEPAARRARGSKNKSKSNGNSDLVRRLVLAAAVLTVVMMVSLVTIAARSSVTDPNTVAERPPAKAEPRAAVTTTAPPPASKPPAAAPPPSPARESTRPPTSPPAGRTREETKAAPSETRPDAIKADNGTDTAGERLTGRDPATGATAEVRLSRTASGLDVSLTVTGFAGPCECVLQVVTTEGAAHTALRWRMAEGRAEFTGLGSTTVDRAAIDRLEIVDATGAVRVTISSR
jgi:hypothetical protein